jgi:hypothetical protein
MPRTTPTTTTGPLNKHLFHDYITSIMQSQETSKLANKITDRKTRSFRNSPTLHATCPDRSVTDHAISSSFCTQNNVYTAEDSVLFYWTSTIRRSLQCFCGRPPPVGGCSISINNQHHYDYELKHYTNDSRVKADDDRREQLPTPGKQAVHARLARLQGQNSASQLNTSPVERVCFYRLLFSQFTRFTESHNKNFVRMYTFTKHSYLSNTLQHQGFVTPNLLRRSRLPHNILQRTLPRFEIGLETLYKHRARVYRSAPRTYVRHDACSSISSQRTCPYTGKLHGSSGAHSHWHSILSDLPGAWNVHSDSLSDLHSACGKRS